MIGRVGLTLIAVAAAAAPGPTGPSKDVEKQFEEFLKKHNKQYEKAEHDKRLQIFVKNAKRVAELKANEAGTAEYSLSGPFADWEPEEFVATELVKEGVLHGQRSRHLRGLSVECPECTETDVPLLDTSSLPTDFDWRTKGVVNPIQKQHCNDCWAFAGTAHLESVYAVQAGGPLTKFSEQQAIDCSVGSCNSGGFSFHFWRELVNTNDGLSTLADYPYRKECVLCDAISAAHGCSSTKDGPKVRDWRKIAWDVRPLDNEDQMAAAVMKYGPILTGIDAKGLQFFAGKVTRPKMGGTDSTCTLSDNHAVILVGFGVEDGVKYWLIRNSWGSSWGDAGYMKMERGTGACGLNQYPITAIMEPPTYVKAAGGPAGCPDRDQVDSAEECRKAGERLGHPFRKIVTTTGDRPGGCFWDQNGLSYFNTDLESTATWGGVGAICRGVYEKAAGAATCPEGQMIKTAEECELAGATVGHSFRSIVTQEQAGTSVTIGSSSANRKCVSHSAPVMCATDVGNRGKRVNSDHSTASDAFVITVNGANVCAQRTDSSGGWGMKLQINCERAGTSVTIGSSSANKKCVSHSAPVVCATDVGNQGKRVNSDHSTASDTFVITVNGANVCARRTDSSGGWGMKLQINCERAPATIANGGFEDGLSGWRKTGTVYLLSTSPAIGSFGNPQAKAGNNFVSITASITAVISLVPDTYYKLTWYESKRGQGYASKKLTVKANGATIAAEHVVSNVNPDWVQGEATFLSEGATVVEFVTDTTSRDGSLFLDEIILTQADPEADFASGLLLPGGCFWDQNKHSYFNTDLQSTTTRAGVGGICSVLRTEALSH